MLSSRYRIVRKLAEGGMAEILLADYVGDDGLTRQVVVKRILADFSRDSAFATMFMGEAKLAAKFVHPNIVRVTDFGIDEGRYFLTMEYVDGFNLRALSRRVEALGRPIPFELAARIVAQACAGLGYAHDYAEDGLSLKLIHRDISPENLLIGRNGVVKVADFGIAKVEGQVRTTRTGMVKGKLVYMAPEQFRSEPVDHRVDIFALGIVLFELCCGRRPFDGANDGQAMQAIIDGRPTPMSAFRPDVPPALQEIVDRAMANAVADRYQSCSAMQQALEKFSSRASAQALAVFVADIAPSEVVTEARTGLVTAPVAVPAAPPGAGPTFNPNIARTVLIEPAPTKIEAPRRPVAAKAEAPRHRADPVGPPVPRPKAEPLRPAEPSGEFPNAAAFRRSPRGLIIGGVVLLLLGAFALGRMGNSDAPAAVAPAPTAEPRPDPKPPEPAPRPKPDVKPEPEVKPPPEQVTPPAKHEVHIAAAPHEPPPKKTKAETPAREPARAPEVSKPEPERPQPVAIAEAPSKRELAGRVTHSAARGYVISNDSAFGWHRCEVRLPNGKFFTFNDTALDPHRQYNIRDAALVADRLESDAYVMQGYAQLRCDEGRKYILVSN